MSSLIPFSFESLSIRVIPHADGSFSVVAKDIAEALGYSESSNAARLFAQVPDEWKGMNPIHTPGGTQDMLTLLEQGLYFFLGRSDKPKALPFQKWLYGEVLPTLRKTGSYSVPNAPLSPAELPIETGMRIFKTANDFAKSVLELNSNHAKLSADICCKKSLNLSVLEYFGQTYLLADPRGKTYTPTELGHFYEPHFSGRSMNLFLECSGLQLKEVTTKSWVPTEKAKGFYEWADTSKQHHSGAPIKQLRWFAVVLDEIIPNMLSAIEARHAIRKAA